MRLYSRSNFEVRISISETSASGSVAFVAGAPKGIAGISETSAADGSGTDCPTTAVAIAVAFAAPIGGDGHAVSVRAAAIALRRDRLSPARRMIVSEDRSPEPEPRLIFPDKSQNHTHFHTHTGTDNGIYLDSGKSPKDDFSDCFSESQHTIDLGSRKIRKISDDLCM